MSLAGTLKGLKGLPPPRDIKVTPYVKGDVSEDPEAREGDLTGGVDAKLGVGTGLSLDLTLNTDFSQVEADVQQVNLTRFSLFFPEKRRFFLENSGIFRIGPPSDPRRRRIRRQFGVGSSSLRGGQSRGDDLLLFFSRRIGLSEDGAPLPVLVGGALKLGEKLTAQVSWSYNDIDLEEGSFKTHLLTSRFNYSFTTNMFLNGLIQYNSVDEEWSANIRFNIIHHPLSDLYIVYSDLRDDAGQLVDRALIAKFTYLIDF